MKRAATLYDKPECPFCWRVRMALHRCSIVFAQRDSIACESQWRELTSAGTVPVLQIDGLTMTDSSVMLEYLNDCHGALWPASAKLAATARATALEIDRRIGAPVRDLVFQRRDRVPGEQDPDVIAQAIRQWHQAIPDLERTLGAADFFVDSAGITDFVLATRFGLAMAYGMPRPESPKLLAWYDRICRSEAFQATAPPRVVAALDGGWQA